MGPISSFGSDKNLNKNSTIVSSTFLKTVCLQDWWLIRAEKDFNGRRLAVGGLTLRESRAMRVFSSAPIVKRLDLFSLETADGFTVLIKGSINKLRSQENGFPSEICSHFLLGFPYYWETYADECLGKESTTKGLPSSMCGFDEGLDGSSVTKTLDRLISTPGVSEDTVVTENIHTEVLERCRGHHLEIPAVPICVELISSSPLSVGGSLTEKTLGNDKKPKNEQKHKHDDKGFLPATNKETKEMSNDPENLNGNGYNVPNSEEQNKISLQVKSENASKDTPMVQIKIEIINSSFAESRRGQGKVKTGCGFKRKSTNFYPSVPQEYEAQKVVHVEEIFRGGTNSNSKRLDRAKICGNGNNRTKASSMSVGSVNLICSTYDSGKDDSTKDASTSIYSDVKTVCQSEVKMAALVGSSSDCVKRFPKNKVRVKKRTQGSSKEEISNLHYVSKSEESESVIGTPVEKKLGYGYGYGYGVGIEGIIDGIEGTVGEFLPTTPHVGNPCSSKVGMHTVTITPSKSAATRTSNRLKTYKSKLQK